MKKKNKKFFIIGCVAAVVLILGIVLWVNANNNSKELSLSEKKWIEDNKKTMIDIYVMNDLPIFTESENDIFLSFLEYFEAETGLSLNKVSYSLNSSVPTGDYLFKIINEVDDIGRNDLLFYEDNYVILSKMNKKIQDLSELVGYKIGILTSNLTSVTEYLGYANNLTFSNYEDDVQLLNAFNSDEVNYIVVPKNRYLKDIVNNNYYVVSNLSNLSNKYVLQVSSKGNKLDSIFTKLYSKWYNNNFNKLFSKNLSEYYFKIKEIDDRTITAFKGKKYIYGYVENVPYEISNNKGLNLEFLNAFENFAGVEFQLKKYSSVKALKNAFDEGKVDIIFNYYDFDSSSSNETLNVYNSSYVILTHINNNVTVDSWVSLSGKEVYALKDTALTSYINNNKFSIFIVYILSNIKNTTIVSSIFSLFFDHI